MGKESKKDNSKSRSGDNRGYYSSTHHKESHRASSPPEDKSNDLDQRMAVLEGAVRNISQSLEELLKRKDQSPASPPKSPQGASKPRAHSALSEGELSGDEDLVVLETKEPTCSVEERFGINTFGEEIDAGLAANITWAVDNSVDKHKLGDVLQKYRTPSNCPALQVPELNGEISEKLSTQKRKLDYKLASKVQKPLLCGITSLAKAFQADENVSGQLFEDSILLFAHASHELTEFRKDLAKSGLPGDFKGLGKKSSHELLFGTDIGKQMRDIKEVKRATSVPFQKPFKPRFNPYSRPNNYTTTGNNRFSRPPQQYNYKRPFLGPARGQQQQGRKAPGKQ